jgi:hypothetical protein
MVVGQEIMAPPTPVDTGPQGQIESQVGIGEEEHPDGHAANVLDSVFVR